MVRKHLNESFPAGMLDESVLALAEGGRDGVRGAAGAGGYGTESSAE